MNTLPEKMKAIVAYAPGDYRLETVDTPRAGEGEMILKVDTCGICAGDVKALAGAPSFWGGEGNPAWIKAPMIPGHEFVGRVVEIGPNVKGNWKIGDRSARTDRSVRRMPVLQNGPLLDVRKT